MNKAKDFYTGYEGEPEYVFRLQEQPASSVRAWGGHIDSIMAAMSADTVGWDALFKAYQLDEGWFNESPWSVPDVTRARIQLELVDSAALSSDASEVLAALCTLFRTAEETMSGVVVIYD